MDYQHPNRGQNMRVSALCHRLKISQQKVARFQAVAKDYGYSLAECLSVKPKNLCIARPYMRTTQNSCDFTHCNDEASTVDLRPGRATDNKISVISYSEASRPILEVKVNGNIKKQILNYRNPSKSASTIKAERTLKNLSIEKKIETNTVSSADQDNRNQQDQVKKDLDPASSSCAPRAGVRCSITAYAGKGSLTCAKSLKTPVYTTVTIPLFQQSPSHKRLAVIRSSQVRLSSTLTKRPVAHSGHPGRKIESRLSVRTKTALGHHSSPSELAPRRMTKSAGIIRHKDGLTEKEDVLKDDSIMTLAARLESYVIQSNLQKFQVLIQSWERETRKLVVNYKTNSVSSSSVFFRACHLFRVAFVLLMLEECMPDLEQTGVYIIADDDAVFQVTPLWYAAAAGNLELVRLLTSFGADVNATTSTGSSVVKAACCMNHVAIVSFLIAHGANIHIKSYNGVSCLMNAVRSFELIKLLVHHGAKINETDLQGNTVLHYAAEAGRLETVKLLVEIGANPLAINIDNCNVIETAARCRRKDMVDYLVTVSTPRVKEIVKAYLVLGAMTILIDQDYSTGLFYWQKANQLNQMKQNTLPRTAQKSVLREFMHVNEATTVEEDLSCISDDLDTLSLQALMVYERLRGPQNKNYLNLLVYRGAVSADENKMQLAINLWKTAYKLYFQKYVHCESENRTVDLVNQDMMKALKFLVKGLHQVNQILNTNEHSHDGEEHIFIAELCCRNVFELVCCHISKATKVASNENSFNKSYNSLFEIWFSLFAVYLQLYLPWERSEEFGKLIQRLMQTDPRGENNATLLHMCFTMQTFSSKNAEFNEEHGVCPTTYAMLEILIVLGADPMARDRHGNTVLHLAVQLHNQMKILEPGIVNMLLRLGAHADQVNFQGENAAYLLPPHHQLRHVLQARVTLKCIAARVVANNRIKYMDEVPRDLYHFIGLHSEYGGY